MSVIGMSIPRDRKLGLTKEVKNVELVNKKVENLELTTQKVPTQSNLNEAKQVPINNR